jgi:hypothetical protein
MTFETDSQNRPPEKRLLQNRRHSAVATGAAIEHAQAMGDWEAGLEAARWMVEEIRNFVAWWDATVERRGGDRQSKKAKSIVREMRQCLSADEATEKPPLLSRPCL